MDEGLLDKIKSIFKKSKKDVKLKEDTAEEMLDKLGVYELDDISDEDLVAVTSIYKKTVGMKYDFDKPIGCVAWLQGLYDGHILMKIIANMMNLEKRGCILE